MITHLVVEHNILTKAIISDTCLRTVLIKHNKQIPLMFAVSIAHQIKANLFPLNATMQLHLNGVSN